MSRIAGLLLAAALLVPAASIPAGADGTQAANKKAIVEFYDAALNRKDFEAAAKFFGPRYVQHWDMIQEIPEKAANNNGIF